MLMASPLREPIAVKPDDESFYKALGTRIADLRRARNLTQQQLAEALGFSQKTVAHYEVGRIRLQVSMLLELSDCLGVSVSALLDPLRKASIKRQGRSRSSERSG